MVDTQLESTEAATPSGPAANATAVINRLTLIGAFTEAGCANSRKDAILKCVLVQARDREDALFLTGTDLEVSLCVKIPAVCNGNASVAIPEDLILSWLADLASESVTLRFQTHSLTFVGEHGETAIVIGIWAKSFPVLPEPGKQLFTIPAFTLLKGIQNTVFAISQEESRFTINSALVEILNGHLTFAATDGHRLAVQEHALPSDFAASFLLPSKAMRVLARVLAGRPDLEIDIAIGETSCGFVIGNDYLHVRLSKGKFPFDWKRVIKSLEHSFELPDPAVLATAIQRVSHFSDERSQLVRLTISHGTLRIRAETHETGKAEECLPIDFEAPKTEIGLNASYLLDALHQVKAPATFSFSGPTEQICISDDAGFRCVILPYRI